MKKPVTAQELIDWLEEQAESQKESQHWNEPDDIFAVLDACKEYLKAMEEL